MSLRKKLITTGVVLGTFVGSAFLADVPQDLSRIKKYDANIETAFNRHLQFVYDTRRAYTPDMTRAEFLNEEFAIKVSEDITLKRMQMWDIKKQLTINENIVLREFEWIKYKRQQKNVQEQEEYIRQELEKETEQSTYTQI